MNDSSFRVPFKDYTYFICRRYFEVELEINLTDYPIKSWDSEMCIPIFKDDIEMYYSRLSEANLNTDEPHSQSAACN